MRPSPLNYVNLETHAVAEKAVTVAIAWAKYKTIRTWSSLPVRYPFKLLLVS
jgi:hypothetical protein